jgi:hypothetical protein
MVEAFETAVHRLQKSPHKFGEALYNLPILRMRICTAVVRLIAIDFAVCTDRALVFIKGVRLLSQ